MSMYLVSFVLGLVLGAGGVLAGAYLVYRKNAAKIMKVIEILKSGIAPAEKILAIQDLLF